MYVLLAELCAVRAAVAVVFCDLACKLRNFARRLARDTQATALGH